MTLQKDDIKSFHCPRWNELPSISLYMDQVIIVLEEAIGPFADDKERVVTPTMVNNYVKQRLIPAPEKKKYGRRQIATLLVVSIMKRVLSMSEITALVQLVVDEFGMDAGYDLFCTRLEEMLGHMYPPQSMTLPARQPGTQGALDAALMALCGKLYLQMCLAESTPP